jgi:hypothetical protein
MAAAVRPAAFVADTRVGTLMALAYQFQAPFERSRGSNTVLVVTPWTRGGTPVMSVVCDGNVMLGRTPTTPRAYAPSFISRSRVGIFRPWVSASV